VLRFFNFLLKKGFFFESARGGGVLHLLGRVVLSQNLALVQSLHKMLNLRNNWK
jgi:transcriptional regulator CtsR